MQNLFNDLESLLQQEQSFISDGAILKNAVVEAALNLDSRLLELLMQSDTIRAHFFTEVSGVLVFDKVKFQDFVSNKAFLPDSYTAFRNRIGLTSGRHDYLSQSRDVVLAWPYKDCVLEGGMTKEDRGRSEIFWNTTLAPDDITRLFEPKVLTRWERWDAEAVEKNAPKAVGEVSEADNLLIKGNNLLALHSLKARYAGKVKLIYIDPPYNTGNDGFRYNDRFNHSAWLTFMRNRLEVARELLSRDGVIVVNLDNNEAHYCKVLLDNLFGRENFIQSVVWNRKVSPANDAHYFSNDHDYLLFYAKSEQDLRLNKLPREAKHDKHFTNPDDDPRGPWNSLTFTGNKSRSERPNLYFGITNPHTGKEVFPPENLTWRYGPEKAREVIEDGRLYWGKDGTSNSPRLKSFLSDALPVIPRSVWGFDDAGHTQQAMLELQALKIGNFSSPKPEKLLQKIIQIGTSEGDIVMDFFSGSGTTPSTAQKMGRRWIAVEQMDYILHLPNSRLKKVIEGEQGGISKAVGWQGGGSFVYAELAASNSAFANRIEAAQDVATLQALFADMQATGYLRYDLDLSAFDHEEFGALQLDDAKRVLMDCLDVNHLYVNLSSLDDVDFNISDEDAEATRSFYGITS